MRHNQPWTPTQATECIRRYANAEELSLTWSDHAKERLMERGLLEGDIRHVLECGFVTKNGEPTKTEKLFKYTMEGSTPNSENRKIGVVVIPYKHGVTPGFRIVTVMWMDEPGTGGS